MEGILQDLETVMAQGNFQMLSKSSGEKKPFGKTVEEKDRGSEQAQKEYGRLKANIQTAANALPIFTRKPLGQ